MPALASSALQVNPWSGGVAWWRVRARQPSTELFLYNEQGQLLGRYDSSGNAQEEVVWLDGRPVALLQHSGSYAGEILAIHADHLGSPRAVTRPWASNALVWEWELRDGVFGQDAVNEDPDSDLVNLRLDLRFPGQQFDSETGLYYNYFRDYEPGVGRYVESDPIGLSGGVSTYGYVEGKPIAYGDPFGLIRWSGDSVGGSVAFGLGATISFFNLVSECVDGKQAMVEVLGVGPASGIGWGAAGYSGGAIRFIDPWKEIHPERLNGVFGVLMASAVVGVGPTCGEMRIGTAVYEACPGGSAGKDVGLLVVSGTATVISTKWFDCGDCCK